MGKCSCCGRKGLFLRVDMEGYCKQCRIIRERYKQPVISTGVRNTAGMVDKSNDTACDIRIECNTSFVPSGKVRAKKDSFVEMDAIPDVFDMSGLQGIDHNFYVLTNDKNIRRAIFDILRLNECIKEAVRIESNVPKKYIIEKKLKFQFNQYAGTRDYCIVEFESRTPSGKVAKYPIELYFHNDSNLFGSLSYEKDGSVGKARIVTWKRIDQYSSSCFVLQCVQKEGSLRLDKIYHKDGGKNVKLYDYKLM